MLLYILVFFAHAAASISCLVPSNSTSCPSDCRLLASLPDAEIIAEFTCADAPIHRCTAPYARVATSVQRALLEPVWTSPELNGTFRTNTLGDGWYTECAVSEFGGEKLLDSVVPDAGCDGVPYVCVCPVPDEVLDTHPELKIRSGNTTTYTRGTGIGYTNGTFTVYAAGYYVVSSETSRDVVSLAANSAVQAEAVEWALRSTNSSLIQVTDGATEHEIGAWFQWNGSVLVIPHRSIWEFVVPENVSAEFGWGNTSLVTQAWGARWIDADVAVHVRTPPAPTFFMRDVLQSMY